MCIKFPFVCFYKRWIESCWRNFFRSTTTRNSKSFIDQRDENWKFVWLALKRLEVRKERLPIHNLDVCVDKQLIGHAGGRDARLVSRTTATLTYSPAVRCDNWKVSSAKRESINKFHGRQAPFALLNMCTHIPWSFMAWRILCNYERGVQKSNQM